MRHYKVVYEKIDTREVWIEVPDNVNDDEVEKIFENNYIRYDDESDEHDSDSGSMNILDISEIDEEGNEIGD
jgi:hypothetical protein